MSNSNYAGFWLRFAAYVVDYIIIQIFQAFLILPLLAMLGLTFFATEGFDFNGLGEEDIFPMILAFVTAAMGAIFLAFTLQVLYFSIMEASKYQGTVGKLVVGLKVTDENGKPLGLGRAIFRNLGKVLSSLLFMIGYIMAGLTDKKQALHDMIAGAIVVKK